MRFQRRDALHVPCPLKLPYVPIQLPLALALPPLIENVPVNEYVDCPSAPEPLMLVAPLCEIWPVPRPGLVIAITPFATVNFTGP